MPVLVIENFPLTPLGLIGTALEEAGIGREVVQAHAGVAVPEEVGDYDGLVVLGGGQDALDDAGYPFLPHVCALIRNFHAASRPVLGICLGSQLIARAFGATNILARPVEFGWHDIRPTVAGRADPLLGVLGARAPLFHWHTDTFTLPADAALLASSAMTPHQAFRLGEATYGIQFHFEAGLDLVRDWSRNFAEAIAEHTPDWADRLEEEAARHAEAADRSGLELARAWVRLLRDG